MTNPFNWRSSPSDLPQDRKLPVKKTAEEVLRASFGGAYSKAKAVEEVTDDRVAGSDSMWGPM